MAVDVAQLLSFTVKNNASDLHLSGGVPPMIRVDGDIKRINMPALTHKDVNSMVYDIMNDKQRKDYEEFLETDFSFEIPKLARFRVNAFNQNRGSAAVFRIIPSEILTLDDLGAPAIFKDVSMHPRGIVLVTGPTGSGKSTTLAAMVDYINENKPDHILTIEDPIEFVHESKKSLINQREVHRDTLGFNEALRSALREDPDVILVGELRDLETIRLALTAAETGHLVFGTLHTSSAAKTIDRIVDVFPAAEKEMVRAMLSESLRAVISQTLLALRAAIPDWLEDAENGLRSAFRILLHGLWEDLQSVDLRLKVLDKEIFALSETHADAKRLKQLRGIGPLTATAMVAQFGDGRHFKRGRQASASVGITPRHTGTGGKNYLFGITKKGNPYLRSILIHGARSVVSKAKHKDDRLSRWVTELANRKHPNVAAVALANKTVRIAWAMLRNGTDYDPELAMA